MDENRPQRSGEPSHPVLNVSGADFIAVVKAVNRALRDYPYFVVLAGLPVGDHRAIGALMRGLAGILPEGEMNFTTVHIQPDKAKESETGTRQSRTHLALSPHTDSTGKDWPHSIVAFQMVRSDARGGGRSNVVPVQDLTERLDETTLHAMREPHFAFSIDGRMPILWESQGSPSMRYYRTQIDWVLSDRGEGGETNTVLLDKLDSVLATLAKQREFALSDGEVLLLNNHKVLHGRTEMALDSERLMYRFRAHFADMPGP